DPRPEPGGFDRNRAVSHGVPSRRPRQTRCRNAWSVRSMSAGSGAVRSSSRPVRGCENRSRWAWSAWRSIRTCSLAAAAIALRDTMDQRQVLLVNLAPLELERQPAMGQLVLDDHEQARGVAVEAVDDAGTILAGQRGERVVVELQRVDQGAPPVAFGRVG